MTIRSRAAADRPEFEIDIGQALDLLGTAVERAAEPRPGCLIATALALAGVGEGELRAVRDRDVRDLYASAALPVTITLGALIVFEAAQRSQGRGSTWSDALEEATAAAVGYFGLLPERMLPARDCHFTAS